MKTVKTGKIKAYFTEQGEKLPDLGGMPSGVAVCVDYVGDVGAELKAEIGRAVALKYRVGKENDEDVRLRISVVDENYFKEEETRRFLSDTPRACLIFGGDVLSAVTALCAGDYNGELAVITRPAANGTEAAARYCSAAALLLSIAEYRMERVIGGEGYDEKALGELRKRVATAVASGRGPDEYEITSCAARIDGFLGSGGGDRAFAHVLSALISRERGKKLPVGILRLTAANVLAETYKQFLLGSFGFVPPPDNNARLEALCDYLGVDEKIAVTLMKDDLSDERIRKSVHSLKVCKAELLAELCFAQRLLKRAADKAEKLLPDCGFDYFSCVTEGDARLAFALSPHYGAGKTVDVMKSMGLIDAFL
ncbi:MAG: hypothetical protein ACI4SC_06250 [Candidatus Neoclostridium sp.]